MEPVSINKTVFPSIELEQAQNNQSGCKGNTKGLAAVMGRLEGRTVGSVLQESKSDLLEPCEACGNLVSKTAQSCPQCGHHTPLGEKEKGLKDGVWRSVSLIVLLVFFCGFLQYVRTASVRGLSLYERSK